MSDIFYTTKLHDKAEIIATSTAASGTAKENLLDKNLNSIWTPNVLTAGNYIDIDTNETANDVDSIGLWIADYNNAYTSHQVRVISDTDSGFGTFVQNMALTNFGTNNPLVILDLTSAVSDKRYIRFVFGAFSSAIKIAHVFLFRKRTHSIGHNLPVKDNPEYNNRNDRAEDQNKVDVLSRVYSSDATDGAVLDNVFEECGGTRRLFALAEGSDGYLCKLTHNTRKRTVIGHGFYEHQFDMKTIPYVEDGESY